MPFGFVDVILVAAEGFLLYEVVDTTIDVVKAWIAIWKEPPVTVETPTGHKALLPIGPRSCTVPPKITIYGDPWRSCGVFKGGAGWTYTPICTTHKNERCITGWVVNNANGCTLNYFNNPTAGGIVTFNDGYCGQYTTE
jgi:hypothetical protein